MYVKKLHNKDNIGEFEMANKIMEHYKTVKKLGKNMTRQGERVILVESPERGKLNVQSEYGGHLPKGYVAVNDGEGKKGKDKTIRNSKYFKDLFKSAKGKKYNYVTYLNKLLRPTDGSKMYIPQTVQCVFKDLPVNSPTEALYCEVVGSRLANALNIPTVFNIPHIDPDYEDDSYLETPMYDGILSVDYVEEGKTTMSLAEIDETLDFDSSLSVAINNFELVIDEYAQTATVPNYAENLEKLKRAFAKQWFLRSIICEDFDFASRNISLLISRDGSLELAPCHDMELFLCGSRNHTVFKTHMKETIDYMRESMPELLDEIMDSYENIMESGEFDEIFENTIKVKPYIYEKHQSRMHERYNWIMDYYRDNIITMRK